MNTLHLFAGAGGGIIADMMLGHTPVGAVEIDPFCRKILKQRQKDGWLPEFPIFEDVRDFNGDEIKGVDCICGGFPCQDISSAGKGEGLSGKRSGLFFELARICSVCRPKYIFLENSPYIVSRGLDAVLWKISKMGYDAEWMCLSASDLGAWHKRERWWCLCKRQDVSDTQSERLCCSGTEERFKESIAESSDNCEVVSRTGNEKRSRQNKKDCLSDSDLYRNSWRNGWMSADRSFICDGDYNRGGKEIAQEWVEWWEAEPRVGRVADGVVNRVDRIRAIGNGQVPIVAAAAFMLLYERINNVPNDIEMEHRENSDLGYQLSIFDIEGNKC